MVEKAYAWTDGATLEEHSRRKHRILREYFGQYLRVRWRRPQQNRFRFAIVDGFAGGGRYKCGSPGSPLIFLEELRATLESVNLYRVDQGFDPIEVECLLICNDDNRDAIELLKTNIAPLEAAIAAEVPKLHVRTEYLSEAFERIYPTVQQMLAAGRYDNTVFNLDQCGHSHVDVRTIMTIMRGQRSVEIFYTFMIDALIAFLTKSDPALLLNRLKHLGVTEQNLTGLQGAMSNSAWMGAAERIVFEALGTCAPFVSPFSINNPGGWRYWFVHFANSYRARQEYNDILHNNATTQAHFGRSGLNMLSYDPRDEGTLYLFDADGRQRAHSQLLDDIPRLISHSGDAIEVSEFCEGIYNLTPAHTQDIHAAIIDNPDIEVITPAGGERRKPNTITVNDTLKLKRQISFFPLFLGTSKL